MIEFRSDFSPINDYIIKYTTKPFLVYRILEYAVSAYVRPEGNLAYWITPLPF